MGSWLNASKPESSLERYGAYASSRFGRRTPIGLRARSPTNWGQGRRAEKDPAPRVPESSFRASARHGSFVDDLSQERGIVSGRVATLPRSAEIKPPFSRFANLLKKKRERGLNIPFLFLFFYIVIRRGVSLSSFNNNIPKSLGEGYPYLINKIFFFYQSPFR